MMLCFVELCKGKMTWFLLCYQLQQIFLSGPATAGVSKQIGMNQAWDILCIQTEGKVWDFSLVNQSVERLDTWSACCNVGMRTQGTQGRSIKGKRGGEHMHTGKQDAQNISIFCLIFSPEWFFSIITWNQRSQQSHKNMLTPLS